MKKEELFSAICENDVAKVGVLLENGVSANAVDHEGKTALMNAVRMGHLEIVRTLIEHGADVNACGLRGETALMDVAEEGNEKIIMMLMQNEADVFARDKDGKTALIHAVQMERLGVVRMLITCGASVNTQDFHDVTALMCAAEQGHAKLVRMLLQNGADVDVICRGAWSALARAAHNGHLDVVRMLLENGADAESAMAALYMTNIIYHHENEFMASILDKWLIKVALGSQRELTSQEKNLIKEQEKIDDFIGQEIKFQASLNNQILLHVLAHAEKSIEKWLDVDGKWNVDGFEINAAFKGAYKRISNEFVTGHFCALKVREFENKIGYCKIKKKYFEISPNIAKFSASIANANLSDIEASCQRIFRILSDDGALSLRDVQFALDFINFDYLQSVQNSEFYHDAEWMRGCTSFIALLEREKAAEKELWEKMVEKSGVEICSSVNEEGFLGRMKRKRLAVEGCGRGVY